MKSRKIGKVRDARSESRFRSSDVMRAKITELVDDVARKQEPLDIGGREERPYYILEPAKNADEDRMARCVPIKPDRIRRRVGEIRALLRVDGEIELVIVVSGEKKAILRRHPNYKAETAEELRAESMRLRGMYSAPSIDK